MLFNSLDKFKRKMVMLIVLLMFAGLMMFVVPVSYVPLLGKALRFIFLVLSILQVLEFISSNKALIHYIRLFVGLLAGMAGVLLFSADGLFLTLLNWLVGTLPILLGGYGLYHALMYARRSGRSGWWGLVILSCGPKLKRISQSHGVSGAVKVTLTQPFFGALISEQIKESIR